MPGVAGTARTARAGRARLCGGLGRGAAAPRGRRVRPHAARLSPARSDGPRHPPGAAGASSPPGDHDDRAGRHRDGGRDLAGGGGRLRPEDRRLGSRPLPRGRAGPRARPSRAGAGRVPGPAGGPRRRAGGDGDQAHRGRPRAGHRDRGALPQGRRGGTPQGGDRVQRLPRAAHAAQHHSGICGAPRGEPPTGRRSGCRRHAREGPHPGGATPPARGVTPRLEPPQCRERERPGVPLHACRVDRGAARQRGHAECGAAADRRVERGIGAVRGRERPREGAGDRLPPGEQRHQVHGRGPGRGRGGDNSRRWDRADGQ